MTTVRRATPDDVGAIRAVGLGTWPATYGPLRGEDYVARGLETWWSAEKVLRGITELTTYVAVGADGAVVGTAVVGTHDGAPMLWKLYVLPAHQGSGAGHALLDAVVAGLGPGAERLRLDHAEGNDAAQGFYQAQGFTELFRHGEGEDREVRMERRLPPAAR